MELLPFLNKGHLHFSFDLGGVSTGERCLVNTNNQEGLKNFQKVESLKGRI